MAPENEESYALYGEYTLAVPHNLSLSHTIPVVSAEIMENLLTRSSTLQVGIRVDGSAPQYTSEIESDRAPFWNEKFLVYVQPSAECSTTLINAHQI
jgi:hypothetical protein